MSYCKINCGSKFSIKPASGKYMTLADNGRVKNKSLTVLSVIRDLLNIAKNSAEAKKILSSGRVLFWNKIPRLSHAIQVAQSIVIDGQRYRISTANNRFKATITSESVYFTIVKNVKKITGFDQITLSNGFTILVREGSYKIHDFVSVSEIDKSVSMTNEVSSIVKIAGPNVEYKVKTVNKSDKNFNRSIQLESGRIILLSKTKHEDYVYGPSAECRRCLFE